ASLVAAVAVHAFPQQLGALVILSGLRCLVSHGIRDEVQLVDAALDSAAFVEHLGLKVETDFWDGAHSATPAALAEVARFLASALSLPAPPAPPTPPRGGMQHTRGPGGNWEAPTSGSRPPLGVPAVVSGDERGWAGREGGGWGAGGGPARAEAGEVEGREAFGGQGAGGQAQGWKDPSMWDRSYLSDEGGGDLPDGGFGPGVRGRAGWGEFSGEDGGSGSNIGESESEMSRGGEGGGVRGDGGETAFRDAWAVPGTLPEGAATPWSDGDGALDWEGREAREADGPHEEGGLASWEDVEAWGDGWEGGWQRADGFDSDDED
ncbi:hypothetical protein T484DRAFT_1844725, partial [Baffinella frigidus]